MVAARRYVSRLSNRHGELWEFEYDPVSGHGALRGTDVDWEQYAVIDGRASGLLLNDEEIAWLREAWQEAVGGSWR